jgi:hypothetical protein
MSSSRTRIPPALNLAAAHPAGMPPSRLLVPWGVPVAPQKSMRTRKGATLTRVSRLDGNLFLLFRHRVAANLPLNGRKKGHSS